MKLLTAGERRQHVMKILISRHADYCRLQPLHASAMTRMLGGHGQMVLDVDRDVLANDVIRAIHDLPAQQRVVALMHWVEKLPVADIAHEMGSRSRPRAPTWCEHGKGSTGHWVIVNSSRS